jgi:hypothetical protein
LLKGVIGVYEPQLPAQLPPLFTLPLSTGFQTKVSRSSLPRRLASRLIPRKKDFLAVFSRVGKKRAGH